MNVPAGLLAVILVWSSPLLGQTATVPAGDQAQPPAAAEPAASSAAAFAPGLKLFLEPMGGFEQLVAEAILKKKVPVVLVHEREQADFVLSGAARVREPGWLKSWVISTHGRGNVLVKDARTGTVVFAYKFSGVNQGVAEGYIYQDWANGCAKHLKKALEKK